MSRRPLVSAPAAVSAVVVASLLTACGSDAVVSGGDMVDTAVVADDTETDVETDVAIDDGPVVVVDAWARQPAKGKTVAAAYVTLANPGDDEVRLRGARSSVGRTELHETEIGSGGVMSMRERLDGFPIPPGGELVMEPGGVHIMFVDIDREAFIAAGEVVVEFDLAEAGSIEVTIPIRIDDDALMHGDMHGGMNGDDGDDPHAAMHEEMHGSKPGIAVDDATGLPDANVLHDLDDELNAGVFDRARQLAVVDAWRAALLRAEIPERFDLEALLTTLARLEAALYRSDVAAAAALAYEAHDRAHGLIPH